MSNPGGAAGSGLTGGPMNNAAGFSSRYVTRTAMGMGAGLSSGINSGLPNMGLPSLEAGGLAKFAMEQFVQLQASQKLVTSMFGDAAASVERFKGQLNSIGETRSSFMQYMMQIGQASGEMGEKLKEATVHALNFSRAFGTSMEAQAAISSSFTRYGGGPSDRVMASFQATVGTPFLNETSMMMGGMRKAYRISGVESDAAQRRMLVGVQGVLDKDKNPFYAGADAGDFMAQTLSVATDINNPFNIIANMKGDYLDFVAKSESQNKDFIGNTLRMQRESGDIGWLARGGESSGTSLIQWRQMNNGSVEKAMGLQDEDLPKGKGRGYVASRAREKTADPAKLAATLGDTAATSGFGKEIMASIMTITESGKIFDSAAKTFLAGVVSAVGGSTAAIALGSIANHWEHATKKSAKFAHDVKVAMTNTDEFRAARATSDSAVAAHAKASANQAHQHAPAGKSEKPVVVTVDLAPLQDSLRSHAESIREHARALKHPAPDSSSVRRGRP